MFQKLINDPQLWSEGIPCCFYLSTRLSEYDYTVPCRTILLLASACFNQLARPYSRIQMKISMWEWRKVDKEMRETLRGKSIAVVNFMAKL